MKTLGVAIVGSGYLEHSIPFARATLKILGVRFVGVAESCKFDRAEVLERTNFTGAYSEFVNKEVISELFGGKRYRNYEELMERDDVDIIIVNNPPAMHREVVVAAAEAGKHVICEKPISTTLKDADEIIRTTEKRKVKLMIPFNLRFLPAYRKVKELVDKGEIGQIISAYGSSHYSWKDEEAGGRKGEINEWRARNLSAGGGLIFEEMVHLVDLFRWLSESEPVEVYAYRDNFAHKRGSPLGEHPEEVEDRVAAVSKFSDGMYCFFDQSFIQGPDWQVRLQGTKGAVHVIHRYNEGYLDNPVIFLYTEEGEHKYMRVQGANRMDALIQYFTDCVRSDEDPVPSGYDGRASLEFVLGVFRSSEVGKPVGLPLKT